MWSLTGISIKLNGTKSKPANKVKYLGIFLDKHLCWAIKLSISAPSTLKLTGFFFGPLFTEGSYELRPIRQSVTLSVTFF